jgi:hypothetical protein
VNVDTRVPRQASHAAVEEVKCRSDILALLRTLPDNRHASLSQLNG